jgi:hypothetical protein
MLARAIPNIVRVPRNKIFRQKLNGENPLINQINRRSDFRLARKGYNFGINL